MSIVDKPNLEPSLPPGIPEGWVYDHDLPCPNCQYNLRMRRTPWCPECGEAYTWQLLLNLSCARCGASLTQEAGERCPECDLPLDWAALIDGVNPQNLRVFEYAPNPVQAALATLWQALSPRRFWETQRLELAPNARRLRGMLVFVLFFYAAVCVLPLAVKALYGVNKLSFEDFVTALIAVCLPLTTFVMLPGFGPTLKICRIRRDQLLRVAAYGMAGIFWSTLICLGLIGTAGVYDLYIYFGGVKTKPAFLSSELVWSWGLNPYFVRLFLWSFVLSLCSVTVFVLFQTIWWWLFLWRALRHFLRLSQRDARALFICTQLIGLLIIAILAIRYTSFQKCIWPLLRLF